MFNIFKSPESRSSACSSEPSPNFGPTDSVGTAGNATK